MRLEFLTLFSIWLGDRLAVGKQGKKAANSGSNDIDLQIQCMDSACVNWALENGRRISIWIPFKGCLWHPNRAVSDEERVKEAGRHLYIYPEILTREGEELKFASRSDFPDAFFHYTLANTSLSVRRTRWVAENDSRRQITDEFTCAMIEMPAVTRLLSEEEKKENRKVIIFVN